MARTHVSTARIENEETGEVIFKVTETPFTKEEEAAADAAELAASLAVPASVTPYQARKALSDAGYREMVEAAVNAAPLDVQDAWHYATVVERASPMIAALSSSLGLKDETLDELFRYAAKVS